MQRLQLQKPRTWETFTKDRLNKMSDSRINCCELAKKRFDDYLYSEYKMNTDGFIKHIKSFPEDERDSELFSVLQSWIDWLVDSFNLNSGSVKMAFSGLNKYLRYHRIKITREDSNEEIEYPDEIREEKYPLSDDEVQLIIPSLMWKNQGFCVGLASGGMRPQELMGTQKKHYSIINGKVKLEIPWYLTKKRTARTIFFSSEFNKYVIPRLNELTDEDFVWTKRKQIPQSFFDRYSRLKEDKAKIKATKKFAVDMLSSLRISFNRTLKRLQLDMTYEATRCHKINLYCFRGRFFTRALKIHGEDTAHAMIGHGAYLQQYQRRTDEEKLELFEKLEPELLIDNSRRKQAQLDCMKSQIMNQQELKEQIKKELKEENEKIDKEFKEEGRELKKSKK